MNMNRCEQQFGGAWLHQIKFDKNNMITVYRRRVLSGLAAASLYRRLKPAEFGHMVTAGCISLLNADVIHLYDRVAIGTRVVVLRA